MHGYITRVCVAAAAGIALTAVGVTGASASGAPPRAVRVSSAGTSRAATSPGTQLWLKRYNGSGGGTDDASSVAVSPSGKTVFVTGRSQGTGGGYDYATVAYNAVTGAQLWASRYNGPGNGGDQADSVAVSPNGRTVFVTGYSEGTAGGYDYATVAYNAVTGHQQWVQRYNAEYTFSFPMSLAVSPNGSLVFITGTSDATGIYDYATVAYNAATGHQQWVKLYKGPTGGNYAYAVTVSRDGKTVFVTGTSSGTNDGYDYATIAYSAATGHQLWVRRYNGAALGDRGANSVAVSPNGKTVFVTGSTAIRVGGADVYDYATIAYSAATGHQLWVKHYHGSGSGSDQADSVAVSPGGKTVFVTGYTDTAGSAAAIDEYTTIAYNAVTGAQRWVKSYNGPAKYISEAYSVVISPNGSTVYVTGSSWKSVAGGLQYATIAYSAATGAQLWARRYGSPGGDGVALSAAVSPANGTVFVTGYSSFAVTGLDYVTIAYKG